MNRVPLLVSVLAAPLALAQTSSSPDPNAPDSASSVDNTAYDTTPTNDSADLADPSAPDSAAPADNSTDPISASDVPPADPTDAGSAASAVAAPGSAPSAPAQSSGGAGGVASPPSPAKTPGAALGLVVLAAAGVALLSRRGR